MYGDTHTRRTQSARWRGAAGSPVPDAVTLASVGRVLRRRWRTIVVASLVGVLVGVLVGSALPTRYSATTTLVVAPLVVNPFTESRESVTIRTEQEILASREVAERAAANLGVELTAGSPLLAGVDVAVPQGSQVLQVSARAGTPEEAASAADALAEAYLDHRREGAEDTVAGYVEKIDAHMADLEAQGSGAEVARLMESLRQQRASVLVSAIEPGSIVGSAEIADSPSSVSPVTTTVGGGALGALVGVAFALVRERTDRRVRDAERLRIASRGLATVIRGAEEDAIWEVVADRLTVLRGVAAAGEGGVIVSGAEPVRAADVARSVRAALLTLADDASTPEEKSLIESITVRPLPDGSSQTQVTRAARSALAVVVAVGPGSRLDDVTAVIGVADEGRVPVIAVFEAEAAVQS